MKHTIEVDWNQVSAIIVYELKEDLKDLHKDLYLRKQDQGTAIWSHDSTEDIETIQKHIDAFKLVLEYYGGEVE